MCCLIRAIAHFKGKWEMSSDEKSGKLIKWFVPLHPP